MSAITHVKRNRLSDFLKTIVAILVKHWALKGENVGEKDLTI